MIKSYKEDYIQNYQENWKEYLELKDGSLDKDRVMRELADRDFVLDQVSKLYERFIGLSKTFYFSDSMIPLFEGSFNKNANSFLKDELCCRDEEELAREILGNEFEDS